MKIAFVHDRIVNLGGAESILKDLILEQTFEEGKIFCIYSEHKFLQLQEKKIPIISALNNIEYKFFSSKNLKKLPIIKSLNDYRNLMYYFPNLVERLNQKLKDFSPDKIIISSFSAVKNIENISPSYLYLHSPMQYIWENYEENLSKLSFPKNKIYEKSAKKLRPWDKQKSQKDFEKILANSEYTKSVAQNIYGWEDIEVSFPKINKKFFVSKIEKPKDYFVFLGRVVKYVREIEKIIELFNENGKKLLIIGDGPDLEYAKTLAKDNIEFLGYIDNVDKKIDILKYASGLVNISKESFGISTAESLCLGVPVFGLNEGNTPYLIDENNGYLVNKKDIESLKIAFRIFETKNFNREQISQNARQKFSYSKKYFDEKDI